MRWRHRFRAALQALLAAQSRGVATAGLAAVAIAIIRLWLSWRRPKVHKCLLPPSEKGSSTKENEAAWRTFLDVPGLPAYLADALQREGFIDLRPIQRLALPVALSGKDLVGIAQTGSGKTLAFLVPLLAHVEAQPNLRGPADGPLALVLAPTRELALQIHSEAERIARHSWDQTKHKPRVHTAVVYGGPRPSDQRAQLRFQNCTQVIVATPGRLLDFLTHGAFSLRRASMLVLDEGDRMLDCGFEEDVRTIANQMRRDRQTLFFSATWPNEVEDVALALCSAGMQPAKVSVDEDWGEDPGRVTLNRNIKQVVEVLQWDCPEAEFEARKVDRLMYHLREMLEGFTGADRRDFKVLVFVKTRRAADTLWHEVHMRGVSCGVMHGLYKQDQRERTLARFRQGDIKVLICTDVLGRGMDILGVTHVVVYDFPDDIAQYVHRIGRTGRNGANGKALTFFEPRPWAPDIGRQLALLLQEAGHEVPPELEAASGWHSRWTEPDDDQPPAGKEELGPWHGDGDRTWVYSTNGGETETGEITFCKGGKLRTTWGWGKWCLHSSGYEFYRQDSGSSSQGQKQQMAISWGGVTDILRLDEGGLSYEVTWRNGRPASTFNKRCVGWVKKSQAAQLQDAQPTSLCAEVEPAWIPRPPSRPPPL